MPKSEPRKTLPPTPYLNVDKRTRQEFEGLSSNWYKQKSNYDAQMEDGWVASPGVTVGIGVTARALNNTRLEIIALNDRRERARLQKLEPEGWDPKEIIPPKAPAPTCAVQGGKKKRKHRKSNRKSKHHKKSRKGGNKKSKQKTHKRSKHHKKRGHRSRRRR